jgi:antitoxin component of MazEF toxin-antitoxin module
MHTTNLRKVGGSIMLAIPPAVLEILNLQSGITAGFAVSLDSAGTRTKGVVCCDQPRPIDFAYF